VSKFLESTLPGGMACGDIYYSLHPVEGRANAVNITQDIELVKSEGSKLELE